LGNWEKETQAVNYADISSFTSLNGKTLFNLTEDTDLTITLGLNEDYILKGYNDSDDFEFELIEDGVTIESNTGSLIIQPEQYFVLQRISGTNTYKLNTFGAGQQTEDTLYSTSASIKFDKNYIVGEKASPVTDPLTLDLTDSKLGKVITIWYQGNALPSWVDHWNNQSDDLFVSNDLYIITLHLHENGFVVGNINT